MAYDSFSYIAKGATDTDGNAEYYQFMQTDFQVGWFGTEKVKEYMFQRKIIDGKQYRRICGTGPFDEWEEWKVET